MSRWWNRNLTVLTTNRSLRALAIGYMNIVVPVYLVQLGMPPLKLGILFTLAGLAGSLLAAGVGLAADRVGRRPFLILLPLFTALAGATYALTTNFALLAAASALGTVGRGGAGGGGGGGGPYMPVEQAVTSDSCPSEARNSAFATLAFAGTVAAAGGAALTGVPAFLAAHGWPLAASYRPMFWATAAIGVVMALVATQLREVPRPPAPARRRTLSARSADTVVKLSLTGAINGLGFGFIQSFIPFWFYVRFGAGIARIGALYVALNLVSALPYLLAPGLARRLGAVRTITYTRLVGVALLAIQPWMPTFTLAAVVYALRMIFNTVAMPVRQSYVMGIVDQSERSGVAGLSAVSTQAAAAVSPTIAGWMFQAVSLAMPFEAAAGLQLLNAVLYYAFFASRRPPEEQAAAAAWDEAGAR